MGASTAEVPPARLAYVYHPLSFAPLSITAAAAGVCSLIWVVDCSDPDAALTARLLSKFGPVVDRANSSLEQTAERVSEHAPDGVLSMHDSDLVWTAQLAALLGLPFHDAETAERLTDKHQQRLALRSAALQVPAFAVIPTDIDGQTLAERTSGFPYPGVLKPRRGQASRNTLPIRSEPQLRDSIAQLHEQSHGGQSEDYVLESYVPDATAELGGCGFANFVSVESVVEHGRVEHAAISARTPFLWPFRETGYFTPSALAEEAASQVMDLAGAAALALGVRTGCLHTEIKLTDEGPVVIEVNGRPGGGMSEMLERASGFSILQTALRLAIGDHVELAGPPDCARIGYLLYVFPEDGTDTIGAVEGLADVQALDGVEELVLVKGAGQSIDWREGSEDHVFHYAGTVADHDELRQLIATTRELVRINGRPAAAAAGAQALTS